MSKYFNALAVAVLGIALLMGAAMAADDSKDITVNGCLLADNYVEIEDSLLSTTVDLGMLPKTNVPAGTLKVMAEDAYDVSVIEKGSGVDGHMANSAALTDAFIVVENGDHALGATATQLRNEVAATSDCAYDEYSIGYTQTRNAADANGECSITIVFTASIDA
jgi:hypothetical protein